MSFRGTSSLLAGLIISSSTTAMTDDALFKAETNCPLFKCKDPDMVPMQKNGGKKKSNWPFTMGCEDSAFDMFSMMSPDMLKGGGMPQKGAGNPNKAKLQPCCKKRDFSLMICGRTKQQIEDDFSACSKKKCKGDSNCNMQSSFGVMMSAGMGGDKCKDYADAQKKYCECVPKDKAEEYLKTSLKSFYEVFAKDKLPADGGELTDEFLNETVYKKFKAEQKPEIWHALFSKYMKDLANKKRPKPDYGLGGKEGLGDYDLGGKGKKAPSDYEKDYRKEDKIPLKFETPPPPPPKKEEIKLEDSVFGGGEDDETVEL